MYLKMHSYNDFKCPVKWIRYKLLFISLLSVTAMLPTDSYSKHFVLSTKDMHGELNERIIW